MDDFSSGSRDNLARHKNNTRLTVCEGNICDGERMGFIFRNFVPDAIFHLAAQINVRESIKNPKHDVEVNIL